jgi:hypothetical protein
MTGPRTHQLADLIDRVREIVGHDREQPPVGRPHVLPLPTAVIAVLFGLRHNMPDEVVAEVFGCSPATITRYHQILQPILRWVTRPEVDQRLDQAHREGVLVDGFIASAAAGRTARCRYAPGTPTRCCAGVRAGWGWSRCRG